MAKERHTDYPRFYHSRGKDSDKKFVLGRMSAIPLERKAEVSARYELIYLDKENPDRRGHANTYLQGEMRKYVKKKNNDEARKAIPVGFPRQVEN